MTKTLADADLEAGLDEAKKKPRYFAIITKGQTIVKMIVQKKRIKEGDIQFARREFGGNAEITGVCVRNGSELLLQVVEKEPALKTIKVKEFITEQTGANVKPQWQVVAALAAVPDDDLDVPPATLGRAPPDLRTKPPLDQEDPYAELNSRQSSPASASSAEDDHYADVDLRKSGEAQSPRADQTPVTSLPVQPIVQPPVAPPQASAAPNTKNGKVRAALEKAMPKIELAKEKIEKGKPDKPISDQVARIQALLDDKTKDQSDLAMSEFRALVALIDSLLQKRGAVPEDKDQSQRHVQLQQCRCLWETTRKKLHEKLQALAAAVEKECQNEEEYDQADVKKKLKVELIDQVMDRLDKRLIDVLDQALNAEKPEARTAFEKQAVQRVADYLEFVDINPLVALIDDNGLIDTKIKPTLTNVLVELSNRLSA